MSGRARAIVRGKLLRDGGRCLLSMLRLPVERLGRTPVANGAPAVESQSWRANWRVAENATACGSG
jgi:hypothetical protein